MFHRVKSESQTASSDQENEEQVVEASADVENENPENNAGPQNQLDLSDDKDSGSAAKSGSEGYASSNTSYKTEPAQVSRPGTYKGPSYPAAYPATPPSSKSSSAAKSESKASSDHDRKLTIGTGITMSGEIEACDHLYVQGTVEAALKGAKVLNIAESGVFYGTVEIEQADVAGRFEGELTVNGRLTVRSSGVISGTIEYRELEVEAGAVIDGRLTPISFSQSTQNDPQDEASSKGGSKSKAAKKGSSQEPANSDEEASLFAESVSAAE